MNQIEIHIQKSLTLFAYYKSEYEKHRNDFRRAMVIKSGLEYWKKELIKHLN